jgi:protein arginine N-methyltransferase 3
MLDSVVWARDKYLKRDGLMVPSHMNMWIAPLSDPDYVLEHIAFWRDVYGFDMMAMQAGIYDDSQILYMPANTLCAKPFPFLQLDLHATTVKDLVFNRKWQFTLNKNIDALDGFVIWFDAFFMPSRDDKVPENAKAEDWAKQERKGIAFTTGPHGKETHWRQGVFFVDNTVKGLAYKEGQTLAGDLEYIVPTENSRALDVTFSWDSGLEQKLKSQSWKMR